MSKARSMDYGLNYSHGLKWRVMSHYSYAGGLAQCAKCGWHNLVDLEIDHINDDGREHREKYMGRSHYFYGVLQRMGFPDDWGLQVLCVKCHNAKPRTKQLRGDLPRITLTVTFDWNNPLPNVQELSWQPLWEESA